MNLLRTYGLLSFSLLAFAAVPAMGQTPAEGNNTTTGVATPGNPVSDDASANLGAITLGKITGTVTLKNPKTGETVEATEGMTITAPYEIVTGEDSQVTLSFSNGAEIELQPGTSLSVDSFTDSEGVSQAGLTLSSGEIVTKTQSPSEGSSFSVQTENGSTALNGGTAVINTSATGTRVSNLNGDVTFTDTTGQKTEVKAGNATNISPLGGTQTGPISATDKSKGEALDSGGNKSNASNGNNTSTTTPNEDAGDYNDPSSTKPGSANATPPA